MSFMYSIVFLGTSHGDPSMTRFCSSTFFKFGDTSFLIDAGEPVTALLMRREIKLADLNAVFLTHMHKDHTGGLAFLLKTIEKFGGDEKKLDVFFPVASAIKPFLNWLEAMCELPFPQGFVFRDIAEGFLWEKNGIRVSSVATEHYGQVKSPSFAFVIETKKSRIMYTGDLSNDLHDFPVKENEKSYDICICEATHMAVNMEQCVKKLVKAPIRKLILNHIGSRWTDGNEHILRDALAALPYPVEIATDGMEVVIE